MHYNPKMFALIVGGSAVVTLGALGTGVTAGAAPASVAGATQLKEDATSTETTPPTVEATTEAVPAIRGPAPLPSEEIGLP